MDNIVRANEKMTNPYEAAFKKHVQEALNWMKELTQEYKLDTFFSCYERRGISDRLTELCSVCVDLAMVARFDKQTLQHLVCLSAKSLDTLFMAWQTYTKEIGLQEESECVTIEYRLSVMREDRLRWSMIKDYIPVVQGVVFRVYREIAEAGRLVAEYEEIQTQTKANLTLFLQEEGELREYMSKAALQAKESQLILWLEACFQDQDITVELDCKEPHLLRQLFTSESITLEHLLNLLTSHVSFSREEQTKKRHVRLSCRPIRRNNTAFLDMLRVNSQRFTNHAQYPATADEDSSFLNLCTLEFVDGETPSVFTILDEPAYHKMTERLTTERNFAQSIVCDENNQRIRALVEKESNRLSMYDNLKSHIDTDVLSITHGDSMIASPIIPCTFNQQNNYYNITINNNYTTPVEATRPQKKKRKRIEPTLLEKYKRVRRTTDFRQADKDINIFRLKTEWVADPDTTKPRICIVCEKEKNLSAISRKKKRTNRNGEQEMCIGIQNICSACLKQASVLDDDNTLLKNQ